MNNARKYTDFDYENLTELYSKNSWLCEEINHTGFENLWFDYRKRKQKLIIKDLINNFYYLTQENAEKIVSEKLKTFIDLWNLTPTNTIFIGLKKHKYPDGSSTFLYFIRSIITEINEDWKESNFWPYFHDGIQRIKAGGFKNEGIELEKVVFVDDFIGTGGTALKRILEILIILNERKIDIDCKMLSLATMTGGRMKIKRTTKIDFASVITLKKGTTLAYDVKSRKSKRIQIRSMESILWKGNNDILLKDHSLGYGKSESLYSWNRFNIPNNNYPLFWWNKYLDGKKRKPIFNRSQ